MFWRAFSWPTAASFARRRYVIIVAYATSYRDCMMCLYESLLAIVTCEYYLIHQLGMSLRKQIWFFFPVRYICAKLLQSYIRRPFSSLAYDNTHDFVKRGAKLTFEIYSFRKTCRWTIYTSIDPFFTYSYSDTQWTHSWHCFVERSARQYIYVDR